MGIQLAVEALAVQLFFQVKSTLKYELKEVFNGERGRQTDRHREWGYNWLLMLWLFNCSPKSFVPFGMRQNEAFNGGGTVG